MATLGTILSVVGGLGMLIFGIQILILAFKTSVGWGLASLFIPLVVFVYVAKNWDACKTPFLRWLGCLAISAVGFGVTMYGAVASATAPQP